MLGLGSRYVCFESVATESLGHRTLEAHVAQVGPTLQPPAESSATTILGHLGICSPGPPTGSEDQGDQERSTGQEETEAGWVTPHTAQLKLKTVKVD